MFSDLDSELYQAVEKIKAAKNKSAQGRYEAVRQIKGNC